MKWLEKDNTICLWLDGEETQVSFPASGGIHIRRGDEVGDWCPILQETPAALPCCVQDAADGVTISCDGMRLEAAEDGSLRLFNGGELCFSTPPHAFSAQQEWKTLRFHVTDEEKILGLGQDPMARLDHNHQERRMWNQWGGHERSGNAGIGFFASTAGYGMLLNTPAAARFCFGQAEAVWLDPLGEAMVPSPFDAFQGEAGIGQLQAWGTLDVFVLPGGAEDVIRQYHALTGLPKLPPKWAFGLLQCKNRYMNRADLVRMARKLRSRDISCDGLIIDWLWFREFGDLTWREEDWPDAAGMLAQLADMGFHVSSAQHPFISEKGWDYEHYLAKGYLNEVPETKRITYDHTNPEARDYWWQKTANLYRQGLRGYWTDMGELEEHFEGTRSYAGGRALTHNAYMLLWAKGLYEGQMKDFGTRAFILARSGCAGLQKYGAAIWSGDINATWQVLRDQVVIAQGMAMSGFPWWCTDIGGFLSGDECTPELYTRWMEWGMFCALFRTHGTRPDNEPWCFGPDTEKRLRDIIRLRYRLLPTIYSLAVRCALNGQPMMRPMCVAFAHDEACSGLDGQMMLGDDLLIAPVVEAGARSKRVYLPQGEWIHYWTGAVCKGGWHTVAAPLGQIPFFVRGGAVLPVFSHIGRNAAECSGLTALVFPGSEGSFTYYDDDGETGAYACGDCTQVQLVNRDGVVDQQVLCGNAEPMAVEQFKPQAAEPFVLDAGWHGDEAYITLTLLADVDAEVTLTPCEGWNVTGDSLNTQMHEMYEPSYHSSWSQRWQGHAGDSIRWRLLHVSPVREIAYASAKVCVAGVGERTVRWDHPMLSDPQLLGCYGQHAPDAAELFANWDDPLAFAWRKDPDFAHNPFGYVDFRRLDPPREGERMLGVAFSRENLFSTEEGLECAFVLRHDSPVTVWLNGEKLLESTASNAWDIPLTMRLKAGWNRLLIRQQADIGRPYSGGEFGYSLRMVSSGKVLARK